MARFYSQSGTENLRANPSVKASGPREQPQSKGKDAGGTENLKAQEHVYMAKRSTTYPKDDPQPGAFSFTDDKV